MKRILVVSGSRADEGLLQYPLMVLHQDNSFDVSFWKVWDMPFEEVFHAFQDKKTDLLLILGDRFEILACAIAAHLRRIPIAHIAGGDITEGSYDNEMRDCISRLASIHFVTSTSAMARLTHMGMTNVHLVGNPGIDYIKHVDWKKERPFKEPYVVVNYQAETKNRYFGAGQEIGKIFSELPDKKRVFIRPNPDRGSDLINDIINGYEKVSDVVYGFLPHGEYLNLIYHCDELIGNSSSMLYEAPELGVKTRMIGNRQKGRTIPWGDGHSSERIVKILKYIHV